MTTLRRFCCNDLLRFTSVNLDHLTETFNMSFYMTYLARWPDYFHVAEAPGNHIMGYIMGKVEGQGESWHGHVTAVTVAPEYRRQQLAKKLMNLLEDISDKVDKAYFVDLFVRASNTPAIKMYEKLDYVIYRRVLRYYSGEEDGLDMRKALSRDVDKKSIIPLKRPDSERLAIVFLKTGCTCIEKNSSQARRTSISIEVAALVCLINDA
ncbi:N-terminal acetyltransferase B complex catalytic subunit NAA20, partial [Cucurbita argyrosperma subsp. sororia]